MPSVNNKPVSDRHNRPSVLKKVLLRNFFFDDGEPRHPYAIRSVHIFHAKDNISPASILGDDGLITEEAALNSLMVFGPAGEDGLTALDSGNFDEGSYTGVVVGDGTDSPEESNVGTSGIYNLNENPGEFGVVLDGEYSGSLSGVDRVNSLIVQNTASSTTEYLDVWTVKFAEESSWTTVINDFELFSDTFFSLTQPLILTSRNKLFNKRVTLGSKIDIKVGTEITIQNKDIDEATKNLFKGTAVSDATIRITKHNDESYLPSRVLVASGTSIDNDVQISSDNTIIFSWDTSSLLDAGDEATFTNKDLGSRTGTYSVQVEYDIVKEHIVSPLFYLIIN